MGGVREEEEQRKAPHAPGARAFYIDCSAAEVFRTRKGRASGCVRPALRAWREALRFAPSSDGARRGRRTPATAPCAASAAAPSQSCRISFRSPCAPARQQEGWLQKLGEVGIASWKKRWFILDERPPEPKCASAHSSPARPLCRLRPVRRTYGMRRLLYYKNKGDPSPQGSIDFRIVSA